VLASSTVYKGAPRTRPGPSALQLRTANSATKRLKSAATKKSWALAIVQNKVKKAGEQAARLGAQLTKGGTAPQTKAAELRQQRQRDELTERLAKTKALQDQLAAAKLASVTAARRHASAVATRDSVAMARINTIVGAPLPAVAGLVRTDPVSAASSKRKLKSQAEAAMAPADERPRKRARPRRFRVDADADDDDDDSNNNNNNNLER
jgi:hypothetical protein